MKAQKPLPADFDDLNPPEFTDEELAQFRPIQEVMPPDFVEMVFKHQDEMERLGKMRPPSSLERVTLQLSPEILNAFRATGKGWQNRINHVLLDYVQSHSPELNP